MKFLTSGSFPGASSAPENANNMQSNSMQSQNPNQDFSLSKVNTGRWTRQQCQLFCQLYEQFGKDWKEIARFIPSRTAEQVRSHAQKYLSRKQRKQMEEMERRQAQRLLSQCPTQRATRGRKNLQTSRIEQQDEPAFSTILENQKINKAKTRINGATVKQSKESPTFKNCKIQNCEVDEMGENNYRSSPVEQRQQIPLPVIAVPQPNFTLPALAMFYNMGHTSFLLQLLMPNLLTGRPFPVFIYNSTPGQGQQRESTTESRQNSNSSVNAGTSQRENAPIIKSQQHPRPNPGFVRVKREHEQFTANKDDNTDKAQENNQEQAGNMFALQCNKSRNGLYDDEMRSSRKPKQSQSAFSSFKSG